jgi:prepilin-type N-terminal cleavage/methylation domain
MRGQTLAVLLVVVLIIAIVAAFIYLSQHAQSPQQKGQQAQTTYGAALQRAKRALSA